MRLKDRRDRRPLALDKAEIGLWLNGMAGTKVTSLAAEDRLRLWPVSPVRQ